MEKIQPSKLKQVVSTDALKYRLEQALGKDEAENILSKLTDEDAESLLNIIMAAVTDDIVTYKTKKLAETERNNSHAGRQDRLL